MMGGCVTAGLGLRRLAKETAFFVSLVIAVPLIVLAWCEKRLTSSETVFTACAQLLALVPGFAGRWLRGAYYFGTLDRCSWEIHIGFGSLFTHRGAELGPRVSMGAYCVIGHARIGEGVMMGSRVSIPSGKRQHLDDEGRLARVTRFERISIGPGSWVGEGAIILAHIGERCIVSAGAVVSKDMPSACLIVGNPARAIRELETDVPRAHLE